MCRLTSQPPMFSIFIKSHHMHPRTPSFSLSADTIMVHDHINLQQISHVLNLSVEQLREYNPQYRGDVIPATSKQSLCFKASDG